MLSPELARNLTELSSRIGRQLGVLVDRRGIVTHVIAGDRMMLFIPELGRARAGSRRFRGLRLLHTHLHGEPLSRDDLTDLSLLRLDLVAAIQVGEGGLPGTLEYATLLPPDQVSRTGGDTQRPWRLEGPLRVHDLVEDFGDLIAALARPPASNQLVVKIYSLKTITAERAAQSVRELVTPAASPARNLTSAPAAAAPTEDAPT